MSAADGPTRELADLLATAELRKTRFDGVELAWQYWSEAGTPLILLHGGFGSWNHWLRNIPELRKSHSLLTLDLPGLGDSSDMPEPHTTEHFARILLRGLDELIGPATHFEIGAFSFGAMIGVQLAALAGSRCERFTCIGAAGFGDLHVQVPLQRPPHSDTPQDEAASIHHANLRALMFSSDEYIDDMSIYAHGYNLERHRFNSRRLSLSTGFMETLPQVRAHLVGVWGSRDATAGGSAAIASRRDIFLCAQAEADFHVLEGVGHWAMYEAPDAVNQILSGR